MKVKNIIPCICVKHKPNDEDSVYYGMPQLKVTNSYDWQWYEVYCPNCGRGGIYQFKSLDLALKSWNELQEHLREMEKFGVVKE